MRSIYLLILLPVVAQAYKEPTHMDMTTEALKISVLNDSNYTVLSDIGLKPGLGIELNIAASSIQKFPDFEGKGKSINDLFRRGAEYEDDNETKKSLNHFFDPTRNTPLDPVLGNSNATSPDWALEDNGDVTTAWSGEQHYSYKEAMNYFYKAMTEQTETARKQNFGLLFQSLGHVVHHLQDMAQPQHVRNDAHCDSWLCYLGAQYNESWYEKYTNVHKGDPYISGLMTGNTYPIPKFDIARKFWTTNDDKGMADYTNWNFVSSGSIFHLNNGVIVAADKYAHPIPKSSPNTVAITDLMGAEGQAVCDTIKQHSIGTFPASNCFIDFVRTDVVDNNAGGPAVENDRAATHSIFDAKLTQYNASGSFVYQDGSMTQVDRVFTLNEFNFKAAYNYLIPRAVAYSAGLINHFFRGKIDMKPNTGGAGYVIKNLSDEDMQGTFTLYYDHKDATTQEKLRDPIPGAQWNLAIAANSEAVVGDYTVPAGTVGKTLVFSGTLGAESNVHAARHFGGWTGPMLGLTLEPNASGIRVVSNDYGNAMVAYLTPSTTSSYYDLWSRRYTPDAGWGAATLIDSNNYYNNYNNSLVMDAEGNALVTYVAYANNNWNLWSQYFTPAGAWGSATLLSNNNYYYYYYYNYYNYNYNNYGNLVMDASGHALTTYVNNTVDCVGYSCTQVGDLSSRTFSPSGSWGGATVMKNWNSSWNWNWSWSWNGYWNGYWNWNWNYGNGYGQLFMDASDTPVRISVQCTRSGDIETHSLHSQRFVSSAWAGETALDTFTRANAAYSYDVQYGYTAPAEVCYRASSSYSFSNQLDANGNYVLFYSRYDNNQAVVNWTRSYLPAGGLGAAVSVPTPIATGSFNSNFGVDKNGNGIAVYSAAGGANGNHIVARHAVPGVGFGDEVELSPVNGYPLIDVSPDGHAAVVWTQQGANGYELWSNHFTP